MKVTLQVNGQEMTFSEKELTDILEKHFEKMTPREGKWFEVIPLKIDENLFNEKKKTFNQEETRKIILAALEEVKKNSRYANPFKTFMPVEKGDAKTVGELEQLATQFGNHMADWVEQALEWAQRIQNGASWEDICNKCDTASHYRLIKWKDGSYRRVGGYMNPLGKTAPSNISNTEIIKDKNSIFTNTVPLVVAYDD